MSDRTTRLQLPFILPSQAQKHVTHNAALQRLDTLVQLTITATRQAPDAAPQEGDCYLIAPEATDAWSGRAGMLSVWQYGAWAFLQPAAGWLAWFADEGRQKIFDGSAWIAMVQSGQASFDSLGIAATADDTNRLALSSPASLFNHAGQGHQLKINKAKSSDTASLLFQSNWTGHAEMGLAGNTDFSIKVSNGSDWRTGLTVDTSGRVRHPEQPTARAYRNGTNFSPTAGQQSGFDAFLFEQGDFAFGAALAAGGKTIIVPATGFYLASLTQAATSSAGYGISLLRNGTETLLTTRSAASTSETTMTATTLLSLADGDLISLGHTGTATISTGYAASSLSLTML